MCAALRKLKEVGPIHHGGTNTVPKLQVIDQLSDQEYYLLEK